MLNADNGELKGREKVYWLWIILSAIVLLLIIVLITKVKIIVHIFHRKDNDHITLKFSIWFGIIRYKLTVPLIKIDNNSPTIVVKEKVTKGEAETPEQEVTKQYSAKEMLNSMSDMKEIVNHVVSLHKIIRHFLSKVRVKNIEWHTVVGLGDAAHTGVISGAIWAVKGSIIGIISNYMKLLDNPKMSVNPHFQMLISQTSFKCMIHVRIGHAIFVGIKLVKFWKGGMPSFKTKPLANLSNEKTKSF